MGGAGTGGNHGVRMKKITRRMAVDEARSFANELIRNERIAEKFGIWLLDKQDRIIARNEDDRRFLRSIGVDFP